MNIYFTIDSEIRIFLVNWLITVNTSEPKISLCSNIRVLLLWLSRTLALQIIVKLLYISIKFRLYLYYYILLPNIIIPTVWDFWYYLTYISSYDWTYSLIKPPRMCSPIYLFLESWLSSFPYSLNSYPLRILRCVDCLYF